MPTRPILRYHGGKWILAPWIISHFQDHRVYVEPYGGAASVLLRKVRSYAEVYNDLDSEVVNLFRVCRECGPELRHLLSLTPFSREEYQSSWQQCEDPMERARRIVIRSFMGFGSAAATRTGRTNANGEKSAGTGFRSNSNRSGTTPAHDWKNFSGTGFRDYTGESDGRSNRRSIPAGDWSNFGCALDAIIERLQGVVIENKDALEIMRTHDGLKTLHYVDPPYVASTRDRGADYIYEMTESDHALMAQNLHQLKGAVIVSGYANKLYDQELFKGWHRVTKAALADGARKRTEVLWMNYEPHHITPGLPL